MVNIIDKTKANQNPRFFNKIGNNKNMGNVGRTYQKVKYAWLAIFSWSCFSTYSQTRVKKVISGNDAISAPSLSEIFAISEIKTIMAAVANSFNNINVIGTILVYVFYK